ncbi:MAG: 50S ribosomal protein L13 [Deltaproteobacteria bacterium]|nr:MAG: 50S ribosomal protein L13 [Deltaproteobacteria bacterium]
MAAQGYRATTSAKASDLERRWYVVDASDQVLGRVATRVAEVLRGKHRPYFTPHVDSGDFVIVVNAEKVRLTGNKLRDKLYQRHSGYTGHLRTVTAEKVLQGAHPERVLESAVRGMLPRGTLGRKLFGKLRVYAGPDHPHAAQKPEELTLA